MNQNLFYAISLQPSLAVKSTPWNISEIIDEKDFSNLSRCIRFIIQHPYFIF